MKPKREEGKRGKMERIWVKGILLGVYLFEQFYLLEA